MLSSLQVTCMGNLLEAIPIQEYVAALRWIRFLHVSSRPLLKIYGHLDMDSNNNTGSWWRADRW